MKQFSAPVENASTVPNHVHSFVVYWRTIPFNIQVVEIIVDLLFHNNPLMPLYHIRYRFILIVFFHNLSKEKAV